MGEARMHNRFLTWVADHKGEIAAVVALWISACVVYRLLADLHLGPIRPRDEFLYWHAAKSFAAGDGVAWRGVDLNLFSALYVWLISLAHIGDPPVAVAYDRVHLINAVAMSAVVIPTYVLARRFVTAGWAIAAAVMALAVPSMNFVGAIGTEALAYPVATAVFAACVSAVQAPSKVRWAVVFAAILLAILTRAQFVVLLALPPLAILIGALIATPGERRTYLRDRRAVLYGAAALILIGLSIVAIDARGVLGLYQDVLDVRTPGVGDVWFWIRGFAADLVVVTGIIPAIVVLALCLRRANRHEPALAALLAVTSAATVLLLLQAIGYSALISYEWRDLRYLYERFIFYLGPLYFVALVAARERIGAREVGFATAVVASVAALLRGGHIFRPFTYDAWGLTWFAQLLESHPGMGTYVGLILSATALIFGAVTMMIVSRHAVGQWQGWAALVAVATVVLATTQAAGWSRAADNSKQRYAQSVKPLDFIDRAVRQPVAMLATDNDYFILEFWNKRVQQVIAVGGIGSDLTLGYTPHCDLIVSDTGRVTGGPCKTLPTAFASSGWLFALRFRDTLRTVAPDETARVVVVKPPVRVRTVLGGRDARDGSTTGRVELTSFLALPGRANVLVAPARQNYEVISPSGRRLIKRGQSATISFPLRAQRSSYALEFLQQNGSYYDGIVINDVLVAEGSDVPESAI